MPIEPGAGHSRLAANVRGTIPALTGIRGVAALMVALFHLPLGTIFGIEGEIPVLINGHLGVDLFFILSGFILMHVHARDFRGISRTALQAFFTTRFFRVYPLHLIVLLAILCFVLLAPGYVDWFRTLGGQGKAYEWGGFFQTLTLTNSIGLPSLGAWNAPSWSLSVEVVGYLFFPILALCIGRVTSLGQCLTAAVLLLGAYCLNFSTIALGGGLARMALCFTAGMFLSRAYHIRPVHRYGRALASIAALWSLAALAVNEFALFSVFGFAALIYALAVGGGAVERFLASPPVMFLGRVSFSLYLSHFAVQTGLLWAFWGGDGTTDTPVATTVILLSATFTASVLLYYTVERPSHALGRRLAGRSRRSAAQVRGDQAVRSLG